MPIDCRMSAMAEAPFLPDVGPFSQARKSQAACCCAGSAPALTTVCQEYEIERAVSPLGPTGIGAVPIFSNESPMPPLSALSHQLAMMIMPVLPETKLSRNGPVVLASAVPIAATEEPFLISVS